MENNVIQAQDVFIAYQKAKANSQNTPWRYPKHWDKISQRKDWETFKTFADKVNTHLSLVDIDLFFRANFEIRGGNFSPGHFLQARSFENYLQFKLNPSTDSEEKLLKKSMMFLTLTIKKTNSTLYKYFNQTSAYPQFLKHLEQGNLHRWLFIYYMRELGGGCNIPNDILVFATQSRNKDDYEVKLDAWWIQFINSGQRNFVEAFFDKFYQKD